MDNPKECKPDGGIEDLDVGNCLQSLDIYPINTKYVLRTFPLQRCRDCVCSIEQVPKSNSCIEFLDAATWT